MKGLALALTFLLGLSLLPNTAAAGELRYRAPAACPPREDVKQRVDARAPDGRAVDLTIEGSAADKAFVGDAVVGTGDDAVHRRLEGQTCDAVIDAMLLVLALDRSTEGAPAPSAADVDVSPTSSGVTETTSAVRDVAASDERPDVRSSVEVALGTSTILRQLDFKTLFGSNVFVEVGAPASLAPWYRPTARAGFAYVSEMAKEGTAEAIFWGAGLEVCPLGVAATSTRHVDVTLSACGALNLGSRKLYASRLWADAGGIGRALVQIGRKGRFRGFVHVDGGVLQRLGDPLAMPSEDTGPVALTVPRNDTMWTFGLGGGVLFP